MRYTYMLIIGGCVGGVAYILWREWRLYQETWAWVRETYHLREGRHDETE